MGFSNTKCQKGKQSTQKNTESYWRKNTGCWLVLFRDSLDRLSPAVNATHAKRTKSRLQWSHNEDPWGLILPLCQAKKWYDPIISTSAWPNKSCVLDNKQLDKLFYALNLCIFCMYSLCIWQKMPWRNQKVWPQLTFLHRNTLSKTETLHEDPSTTPSKYHAIAW